MNNKSKKTILLFGAGRSASVLIDYLLDQSKIKNIHILVADIVIPERYSNDKTIEFHSFSIENSSLRQQFIRQSDIVISLMPPDLHIKIAEDCILFNKHFLNASYLSPLLRDSADKIKEKNLIFITECGLDPGIDHMSSMKLIHQLKKQDAHIISYQSYTGGLVAPESDTNPWGYKITWNPRNVVLAGQGISRFKENGITKYIPYQQLFQRLKPFHFENIGDYEGYINRDSSSYATLYNITETKTFIRGTLRKKGYCSAWNILVQLGMTDDQIIIDHSGNFNYKQFTELFLPEGNETINEKILKQIPSAQKEDLEKIEWLGLFSDEMIPTNHCSAAHIIQKRIEEKWKQAPGDKDMILMHHEMIYEKEGQNYCLQSALIQKGEDSIRTAMAKTVGLPLGIAAILVAEGKFNQAGLHIPTLPDLYEPILSELKNYGIFFTETQSSC